jgi:5-(carboxyamino)imidazole ribonucleotide synthase
MSQAPLAPGSVIGIVGGGQLGRMLAMAAARLGYRTVILEPDDQAPAAQVANRQIVADYDDREALAQIAKLCDVVTYEFENVPVAAIEWLEAKLPVRPGSKALRVAQDRLLEKAMAHDLGAETALFAAVADRPGLDAAMTVTGLPAVLKTTRLGYDGKGQAKIVRPQDAEAALAAMRGQMAVLESFVHFECEVSVVAARGLTGEVRAFDLAENIHRDHILHSSTVPSKLGPGLRRKHLKSRRRSPVTWITSAYSRSSSSPSGMAPGTDCWSMKLRRGCTIPVTGPKQPVQYRSLSNTSALLPDCLWGVPVATRTA